MARGKRRKKNQRNNYGQSYNAYFGGDTTYQNDGNEEMESMCQVPPELAPYALSRSSQIPPSIRKYWKNRTALFSYFDGSSPTGMLPLLDEQSWFSITPESIAARIAQRCQSNVVLDAFCGAGGNAIQFASTCQHVLAIDIDPVKLLLAKHNAEVYGVKDRITFLLGDWRDFAKDWMKARQARTAEMMVGESKWMGCEKWDIDVVFLSPPWGGTDYRRKATSPTTISKSGIPLLKDTPENHLYDYYSLSRLEPSGGKEMYELATTITSNICMYLPRTVDLNELVSLVSEQDRSQGSTFLEVEEQWLGNRCKAIACYYGDLTNDRSGQPA